MKFFKSLVILLAIGAALVLGAAAVAYSTNRAAEGTLSDDVTFTVANGETVSDISARLEREELIRSALFLSLYSRVAGTESALRAGTYLIPKRAATVDIHDLLLSGRQVLTKVTIPEGWTASRIALQLEEAEITDSRGFLSAIRDPDLLSRFGIPADSAEGYLYPDTYLFQKGISPAAVAEHLIETLYQKIGALYPDYGKLTASELHDKIVLASIVEREYKAPEEASLISSVFYNRLDARMRLQSCATVAFVITEVQGMPYPSYLTYADLEILDPYNTYRNRGLPPGPIANPGNNALKAAFFPDDSDFLYFVLQNPEDGNHYFSKSLGEHNTAKSLYLKSP